MLRPCRSWGEIGSWVHDISVVPYLQACLARYRCVAIGEYHIYGADADGPVLRRAVDLARQHGLFLHSHGDADAIARESKRAPNVRILRARSGFDRPERVGDRLRKLQEAVGRWIGPAPG